MESRVIRGRKKDEEGELNSEWFQTKEGEVEEVELDHCPLFTFVIGLVPACPLWVIWGVSESMGLKSQEMVSLSLPDRNCPCHSCFFSSEDLRGELEKEEKGMMVVVTVSTCHLAMWRYSDCLYGLCAWLVPSAHLPKQLCHQLSFLPHPHNYDSFRSQWGP